MGQVKTRLGQTIGFHHATQLYRCFTEDVLETIDALNLPSFLCFTPMEGFSSLRGWLGEHRTYLAQQGEDLGDRMAHAFRACFDLGYQQVLVIGTDMPDLSPSVIREALVALAQDNIVIGPSEDGGYYALGFTPANFCPDVFVDMPWSTDQVYSLTLERLNQQSCPVVFLPLGADIDTFQDLGRFDQCYRRNGALTRSLAYLNTHRHDLFSCPS